MFNLCEYKWYLAYIKKINMFQDSIHLLFGTSLHDTLQLYFKTHLTEGIDEANAIDLNSILKGRMKTIFEESKAKYGRPPCTLQELKEFYQDGVDIIEYIKNNPLDIMRSVNYKLIGVEYPVRVPITSDVNFTGNLDFVFEDVETGIVYIKDFKTSTNGWDHWQLDDKSKTQQLLLYKKFYSDINNIPLDKIKVEYIILKRKIEMPHHTRVQLFTPDESARTLSNLSKNVKDFVSNCFVGSNFNTTRTYTKTATNKACMFCDYNNTEYCDAPNYKYNKDK